MAPNPAVFNLSDLDGNNGFAIDVSSLAGTDSSAGDINGDGFDDLIFKAGADNYVVFGSSNGLWRSFQPLVPGWQQRLRDQWY